MRSIRDEKIFELAESCFCPDMECDFHIRGIFLYRDQNHILNPWLKVALEV